MNLQTPPDQSPSSASLDLVRCLAAQQGLALDEAALQRVAQQWAGLQTMAQRIAADPLSTLDESQHDATACKGTTTGGAR